MKFLSICLGIDLMDWSIISMGKAKTVSIILSENCLKISLVRFLHTASSLSILYNRWKTFSMALRSGECSGKLNKTPTTLLPLVYCSFYITILKKQFTFFYFSFQKHIKKLFFSKLSKLFSINSPFILATYFYYMILQPWTVLNIPQNLSFFS